MIYTYLIFHLGTPFENQVIVHTASLIRKIITVITIIIITITIIIITIY
jgi:hypothetical protein